MILVSDFLALDRISKKILDLSEDSVLVSVLNRDTEKVLTTRDWTKVKVPVIIISYNGMLIGGDTNILDREHPTYFCISTIYNEASLLNLVVALIPKTKTVYIDNTSLSFLCLGLSIGDCNIKPYIGNPQDTYFPEDVCSSQDQFVLMNVVKNILAEDSYPTTLMEAVYSFVRRSARVPEELESALSKLDYKDSLSDDEKLIKYWFSKKLQIVGARFNLDRAVRTERVPFFYAARRKK